MEGCETNGNLQIKEQMDKLMLRSSKTQSSAVYLKRGTVPYSPSLVLQVLSAQPPSSFKDAFLFAFIPLYSSGLCFSERQQPLLDDRRTDCDLVFSPVCWATLWAVSCTVAPQGCWESKLCARGSQPSLQATLLCFPGPSALAKCINTRRDLHLCAAFSRMTYSVWTLARTCYRLYTQKSMGAREKQSLV